MEVSHEDDLIPPCADRVAARALVLAAVSFRGLIENEKDSDERQAEFVRKRIVNWLQKIEVSNELESIETALRATPVGELDRRATIDATWRSEGLAVLAWALHRSILPPVHVICEPNNIAKALGFLEDRRQTPLVSPDLRDSNEIRHWANTYLTLHWRLRQFSLKPGEMDFASYVATCKWVEMTLADLKVVDRDLAINGIRIDRLDQNTLRSTISIVRERRIALDWLLGFETQYSGVTTDT